MMGPHDQGQGAEAQGAPPYGGPPPPAQQPYGAPPQQAYPPPGQAPYAAPGHGAPPGYGQPTGPTPAGMADRLVARIIDGLVILGVFFVAMLPGIVAAGSAEKGPDGEVGGGTLVLIATGFGAGLLFALTYEVVMIARRGQTVGKRVRGIKVLRERDLQVPGFGAAAVRWVIPLAASILPAGAMVVFLSPFLDKARRQGWHDKAAKTVVVYA